MAEYIEREALLKSLDMAMECKDCPRNVNRKTYYDRCACSEVGDICNIITDFPTATDVQPVDRGNLQIVYIGRKAYHAENTIRDAIEAIDTIRDAIGHIEYAYSKHKNLLSQISCCTKDGDVTPEIDYYINKIKKSASQIN